MFIGKACGKSVSKLGGNCAPEIRAAGFTTVQNSRGLADALIPNSVDFDARSTQTVSVVYVFDALGQIVENYRPSALENDPRTGLVAIRRQGFAYAGWAVKDG